MRLGKIDSVGALACIAVMVALPTSLDPADEVRTDQWHLSFLKVGEAHKYSQGRNVIVAVVDTGVDHHPDLRGNVLPGTDLTRGSSSDDSRDLDSHGTAVAGLIAAHGRPDGNGALGIAPGAKILPIRDRPTGSQGSSDDLAAGIEWAIAHNAKVISVSSAGGPSPRLRAAVEAAVRADVVIVAGAGNAPAASTVGFPAALEGVLAVGATDRQGSHADISVTGEQIAISAPGEDIFSTSIDGKYSKATGTSASTAIVAGAVALVRSKYPDLSAQEVVHRLTATATDKGAPGRDEEYGYGVVNLVAALTADVPPLEAPTTPSAEPPDEPDQNNGLALLIALSTLAAATAILTPALLIRARRRGSPK